MQNSFIAARIDEILKNAALNLPNTAERAASIFTNHIFWGLDKENFPKIELFPCDDPTAVTLKNIPFISFCEHHLVPFFGTVEITFIPQKTLIGFSKVYEIVHYFSKRPQLQERLGSDIGKCLNDMLQPQEISVHIKAKHFCIAFKNSGSLEHEIETLYLSPSTR